MCGIIGYIGDKQAASVILDGLRKLEYRGYDSAGLAILNDGDLSIYKEKGKIDHLAGVLAGNTPEGFLGIGHTRWATHGEPNKINAHPHFDCSRRIAVVHNGIIENYQQLKTRLKQDGHKFYSDTDSEVVAHLIEEYYDETGDFLKAVRLALKELEGSYALAIMCRDVSSGLIAARNGSPLILGVGEKENFIASDIPAVLKHTKKIIVLEDYQIAELTKEGVRVINSRGEVQPYEVREVEWNLEDAERGGYSHFMLKEINEQPQILRKLFNYYVDTATYKINFDPVFISRLGMKEPEISAIKRVIVQACGTSFHAGLIGKYLFSEIAKVHAHNEMSSEFRYHPIIADPETLVISITQSGETSDTLMGMREAKAQGLKTLSLCNVVGSTISRESNAVIYTYAGPEIGVASTKAYTAQLFVFYLLAVYLGEKKGFVSAEEKVRLLRELQRIPDLMEQVLARTDAVVECAERFYTSKDFLYLGRKWNYPSALEGALKLKEIAYVHASAHAAGEMKHGPIALIDENVPVVCFVPKDSVHEKMMSNIQEVKARKGKVIAIATEGDEDVTRHSDYVLYMPKTSDCFYPLLAALPLQLFAYYVALNRGCEIDQPRNLAKSVTVE